MNRKKPSATSPVDVIAATAAEWVMRLDRGLSPDEQDGYLQWLATDPRHAPSIAPSTSSSPKAGWPCRAAKSAGSAMPVVDAGQRAVVPRVRRRSTDGERVAGRGTVRRLAWQPRMLTFTDEPLAVILNEFNRHNPVVLRIDDPALQDVRLSARFRSDNVQGFLRLLESDFRVRAEQMVGGEVVLRSAR